MKLKKEVISPGIYYVGGRFWKVSRADTLHWCRIGNKMLKDGLQIPLPLEHQDVKPISHADRLANKVKHNGGYVDSFSLSDDGTLHSICDVVDAKDAERAPFVSPEFDRNFVDGSGKSWKNVITHLALTPTPVWHKQKRFEPVAAPLAVATGESIKLSHWSGIEGTIRLSLPDRVTKRMAVPQYLVYGTDIDEEDASLGQQAATEAEGGKNPPSFVESESIWEKAKQAADETYSKGDDMYWPVVVHIYKQMGGKKKGGQFSLPIKERRMAYDNIPAGEPAETKTSAFDELLEELAEIGLVLPDDTDESNFQDRLCAAAKTYKAMMDKGKPADEPPAPTAPPREEPQTLPMSIQTRLSRMDRIEKDLADERLDTLAHVTDAMVEKGQATPAQAKRWMNVLGAKRMSLAGGDDREVEVILGQIKLAKEVPEGTFWSPEERTKKLSRATVPDEPDFLKENDDRCKDVIKELATMAGVLPKGA